MLDTHTYRKAIADEIAYFDDLSQGRIKRTLDKVSVSGQFLRIDGRANR